MSHDEIQHHDQAPGSPGSEPTAARSEPITLNEQQQGEQPFTTGRPEDERFIENYQHAIQQAQSSQQQHRESERWEDYLRVLFAGKERRSRFHDEYLARWIGNEDIPEPDFFKVHKQSWLIGEQHAKIQPGYQPVVKIEWIDEPGRYGLQVTQTCFLPWTDIWFERQASEHAKKTEPGEQDHNQPRPGIEFFSPGKQSAPATETGATGCTTPGQSDASGRATRGQPESE